MNKLIRMATVVVGVGAMLGFAGCGNPNTPESAFERFIQSATTGDLTGYWESTYPAKCELMADPAKMTDEQKDAFKAILLGVVEEMHLDDLKYLSTEMNGENAAKVFASSDAKKITMSFVCRKIEGKWKISGDTDDMKLVIDEVLSTTKKPNGAQIAIQKMIDAAKKGKLTDEMMKASFDGDCDKEEMDGIVQFFKICDLRNSPDYKNAPPEEKAEADKMVAEMGIRSASMSATSGYAIIALGTKSEDMMKIKVVEKKGKWVISGLYIAEVESLKRAQQAENVFEE